MPEFFLGLDSTDSPRRGCTTHVAALLAEAIMGLGGRFNDYPHLVRLNPNIPFKTRGNGSVCLNFTLDGSLETKMEASVGDIISKQADLPDAKSDPGFVIAKRSIPAELRLFAERCLHDVVTLEEAEDIIRRQGLYSRRWKSGRGLIGGLAAIGMRLPSDYIFELIAYRIPANLGTPRRVDLASVEQMNETTWPETFNNIDEETGRILITPRGPDPVLLGIRGESPESVLRAFSMLTINEPVERWVIFRSNECTDSHLLPRQISQLSPHTPATLQGTICSAPIINKGGHVFVDLEDETGRVSLAAYEPTGGFRRIVLSLMSGDHVIASGGVKPSPMNTLTLNLESITPSQLIRTVRGTPTCPHCMRRMESAGRGQGYRCRRCKNGAVSDQVSYPVKRELQEGRKYQPPLRAHRHLTRPLSRNTPEKEADPIMMSEWNSLSQS